MKADTHPAESLAKMYQLRNELRDLNEVVSTEISITIILDASPVEKYATIKHQTL